MSDSENPTRWCRDLLLLALVFGVWFGFELGHAPLANPDEGRYAEIPREMAATGDWVTPRLDGVAYFEKPPLMYWAVAGWMKVFGRGEGSMRAVPALFGLGGVLLTYAAGRELYGRRAGRLSALVLGTSLLYMAHTHILILDMAVAVLMSATLFCFILAVRRSAGPARRWLFYGLYASAALATLTKGLIGFLLTGAVMLVWLLLLGQWKRLRPLYLPTGALLFLVIAAPWHLLVSARNPAWARFYFIHEHWERFTTTEHGRVGPWWYFVPVVLLGLFPWTGFLWQAVRGAIRGGWARRRENADAWFMLVWAGFIFLFFSKSQSKLIPYILPVFPPLAVLIGNWLAGLFESGDRARADAREFNAGIRVFSAICALLAVALVVVEANPGIVRMDRDQFEALRPFANLLMLVFAAGALAGLLRIRPGREPLARLVVTMALVFGVLTVAEPHFEKPGTKDLALKVAALARPGDKVYHYHEFFHDFTFYAQRTVGLVGFQGELEPANDDPARIRGRFIDDAEFRREWAGPGRLFAVARKRDVGELFGDPTFHYHLLGETPDHYLFSNQN